MENQSIAVDTRHYQRIHLSSPSQHLTDLNAILYEIEMLILLTGNISCIIFIVVLCRSRCFHLNLRLLMANFCVAFLVVSLSRYMIIIPLCIAYHCDYDISSLLFCRFAKSFHDISTYVLGLSLLFLIAERTTASILVRSYETGKLSSLGGIFVVTEWIAAVVFVALNQVDHSLSGDPERDFPRLPCQKEYISSFVMAGSIILLVVGDIVAISAFLTILKINKRRYRKNSMQDRRPHLSERYQISNFTFYLHKSFVYLSHHKLNILQTAENIHTTRLLCVFVGTLLAASILACSVLLFSIYSYSEFIRTNNVRIFVNTVGPGGELFQSFDLIVALVSLFFPFICIHGHIALRRRFRGLICGSKMDCPIVPRTIDGGRLVSLPPTEETAMHFKSLRKMWDATELHWNVPDKTKA